MRSRLMLLLLGVFAAAWARLGGNHPGRFQRPPLPVKASEPQPPTGTSLQTNYPVGRGTLIVHKGK